MRKRKSRACDRLSELHDSLIFCIFEFLPTRDAVRTTILSKRWRNLWNTVPWLHFVNTEKTNDTAKDRNFVAGALNSWRGIKITKFEVEFVSKIESSYVDDWVNFAIEKKVEDLDLSLPSPYSVPENLYSCSSLKNLSLTNCQTRIEGNVQWDHLKKLRISSRLTRQDSLNKVLCGSPKLEELHFAISCINRNLSIKSTTLKKLTIQKYFYFDPSKDSVLKIWAPNLKTLVISGTPYPKLLLMNVPSLTKVFLEICGRGSVSEYDDVSWINFAGEALRKILPTIKHVESQILSDQCIKALGDVKEKGRLPCFPNAKLLMLQNWSQECINVLGAIESFPKLKNLVLETTYQSPVIKAAESWVQFDRKNFPRLFLQELRTVEVTWTKGDDSVFPLIQILLKYARNLEKMVFRTRGIKPWKSMVLLSQKLLRMRRSSPTAELIIS